MRRQLPAAALALLLGLPTWCSAQPNEPGLPDPGTTPSSTAPVAGRGTPSAIDLTGAWTEGLERRPRRGAPGSWTFSGESVEPARPGSSEATGYLIRVVANARDGSLASPVLAGRFDGSRLTITWLPALGAVKKLEKSVKKGNASTDVGQPRTVVYAHSSDDEFDRLRLESGAELPDGVAAPRELRRLKPPQVVFPAEWEQSDEILWGYQDTFAVSLIYRAALRGCFANGESVKHRFYVSSPADRKQLAYELAEDFGDGPAQSLIAFRERPFDSVWMRDYGPWTVRKKKDGQRAIGDTGYYADRPDDDRLPVDYAALRGWERLDLSSLRMEGGNIMSDGRDRLFLTGRVLEGSGKGANDSQEAVEASLRQVGAREVYFFERMAAPEGTGHIDMFAKLMDERTVLVGRHQDPRWSATLDRNAARFAALGYRVERVDFARPEHVKRVDSAGRPLMTYTNSLFVGRTVLVTAYRDLERDRAALEVYRRLGWKPVGIDVRSIIGANGAIHCISMQVPAR